MDVSQILAIVVSHNHAMIEDASIHSGLFTDEHQVSRCVWCRATPEYQRYHDQEWGFPVQDDRRLYEKICLEGFQAGLSWLTILNKREAFRRAFAEFDIDQVQNACCWTRELCGTGGRLPQPSTTQNEPRSFEASLARLRPTFGSMSRRLTHAPSRLPANP